MASLMDAVAKIALKRRSPPVAASCLLKMDRQLPVWWQDGLRKRVYHLGFVIIDMEFQDIAVVNSIGDGVGV